jgi:hypothetical protein
MGQPDLLAEFAKEVVFMPFVETALFHLLVIELLRRAGLRRTMHIVPIAAFLFVSVHATNRLGVFSAITVIPVGIVLAWCYLYWRRTADSRLVAFSATWLAHGLHNLYVWTLNFVPASLIFG